MNSIHGVDILRYVVVLFRLSTSNHNHGAIWSNFIILSYIVFLHQTTTLLQLSRSPADCLISSFYIKPQLLHSWDIASTHCLISSFYIKPQLYHCALDWHIHCLISSFYIKPQRIIALCAPDSIVLYRLSTSNHNPQLSVSSGLKLSYIVFLHQTTTLTCL